MPDGGGGLRITIGVNDEQFRGMILRGLSLGPWWQRFYERVGLLGERTMKEFETAVDSGNLRSSIRHRLVGGGVEVGPSVRYAPYVEFGTGPSPGRYVPAIGRRLVNPPRGVHPGNIGKFGPRGLRFVEKTYNSLIERIPGLASEMLSQYLATGGV